MYLPALAALLLAVAPLTGQQPTFRSSVDLIAVDVQVLNGAGNPVERLGPQAFDVAIKGQRRRVVSAEFIRHARPEDRTMAVAAGGGEQAQPPAGRTIILAFDMGSFHVGAEKAPIEAMRGFLAKVGENDSVGLWTFPRGTWIPPTTQRAPLRVALSLAIGGKQPLWNSYHLRPAEIVDITAESTNPHSFLTLSRGEAPSDFMAASDPVLQVQRRECPGDADCPIRIYQEGLGLAAQIEQEVQESLSGLQLLLSRLAAIPGRKSVVLVSAGLMVSDRLEGRPDVGKMAETIGQIAARANTTVYTIHFDQVALVGGGVGAQRSAGTTNGIGRDRALFGTFLDQFSDGAGGKRLYVPTGQGDFAFDQVLRESSGYYLLGVEPDDEDRDGKPRRLQVKVSGRDLTVRSRQWVVVPTRAKA
jgi:VWFA-related protein